MSDTWLEKPYDEAAEDQQWHERFQQTPDYFVAFNEWLWGETGGDE